MKNDRVKELESRLVVPVEPDAQDVFAQDGTDLTQIRFMLGMTPTERVNYAQSLAQSVIRLRHGVEQPG